jgi:hypothetical protein
LGEQTLSSSNLITFPVKASGYQALIPHSSAEQVTFTVTSEEGGGNAQRSLGSRDLYPSLDLEDSFAGAALRALDEVLAHIHCAEEPDRGYIDLDTELMKAKGVLIKAFDYRESLGDGYSGLVNAAIWALANSSVQPPSRKQLRVLSASLHRLRDRPYMHFDTAMALMDDLESEGFDIEPPALDDLLIRDDD